MIQSKLSPTIEEVAAPTPKKRKKSASSRIIPPTDRKTRGYAIPSIRYSVIAEQEQLFRQMQVSCYQKPQYTHV